MPKRAEWYEKTHLCETCFKPGVRYQKNIFCWMCFECGSFDRLRNERATVMGRPVLKLKYDTEATCKTAAEASLELLPDGWEIKYMRYPQSGWGFLLEKGLISVGPTVSGEWSAICGVEEDGAIKGGPWTTASKHGHPGKAAVFEAEAMGEFVQCLFDHFQIVGDACEGLAEFETPEKQYD